MGQISASVRFWHTEQQRTLRLASVIAAAKASASASGRESVKNARRCALFLPMPGSMANLSMRFSSAAGKKDIYFYLL